MTTITLELPGSPQGKGRARHTRAGITYTPAATRSYEASLAWTAAVAMKGRKPLTGPVRLGIEAFMPIPTSWSGKKQRMAIAGTIKPTTKPDCDNLMKVIDGLNRICWADDSQIIDARITKRYDERPRMVITITPVDEAGARTDA
jgi:Holliday junction resolvase RusA-like endonuclease